MMKKIGNDMGFDQSLMKQLLGMPDMQDPNNLQLPSLQQLQQNFLQNPFAMQQQNNIMQNMNNPFNNMMDMNQLQNQLNLAQRQNNSMLMGQGGQDFSGQGNNFNQGMLPPISQLTQNTNQIGGIQLPSLSQISQNLGQGLGGLDPFGFNQNMLNMFQQPQAQNYMNAQQSFDNMSMFQNSGLNTMDDFSLMLRAQQQQQQFSNLQNMTPFAQYSSGMGTQPGFNDFMSLNMQQQLSPYQQNQYGMPIMQQLQPQRQQIINNPQQVESLIQPDNNDIYNDRQEQPVPPAIIDPGNFDLTWILDRFDTQEELETLLYLTQEEIQNAIKSKNNVDQVYLVKWTSLSYLQSTYEPESLIQDIYDEKIQDYFKFNRSLDSIAREKLDSLIRNHKKMLRITERKYQTKKLDPNQENMIALQEAKINRQLLNAKVQELMGQNFNQIIQYSEKKGFVPVFKKPHFKLKDYQILGLNWLIRAWHEHRNVVLADEMGLGKTIMTLSLFDHLNKFYKLRGPFLILAPLTTLEHWKRIADEWTSLNSVLYYDPSSSEGRQEIRQWEWYFTDITYKGAITQKSELFKFNLIITSFEVFVQDLNNILQQIPFIQIVVDEAHRLKNKQAKTLKLLKDHPCKRILLLTGTPVQNNTKELWTLLNYIEPEKFHSLDNFLGEFGNLESFEQITKLHTILKPHFLRRLKEEVDNSIPPLQETVIEVGLTNLQNAYYKGIYGENRMILSKFGTNSIKTSQLNNIDIQLRKCCNHLFLLKGVEEELTKDCKDEEDLYKKLLESSGKLMLLNKFIDKFRQENHKMLIFSQFKRMLDIIELYLRMKGVPYEMLTGSVKTQDRISAIQRFNEEKTFGVFLLTTRAGGLGINLTSARVVIIFDSDWNPQNDLQAIARAHRIGQRFEVQVYRLITSKTYEEQMFEKASKKLGMEQAVFSKGVFNQDDEPDLAKLTFRGIAELKHDSKEIENLLKYGAYAFIDNEDNEDQNQFNKDIDEILATGKKKEFSYNKGVYQLQKSTFNASKYENLPDVNDPEFWNKVLPFDSIMSICILEKRFKKEKRELQKNDKMQKEFIKDLEVVFNDFMDIKFDSKTSNASKKQLESDEEKLREILKKIAKMNGFKLLYQEKCKEWLREMFRTNKRKKPIVKQQNVDQEGLDEDEDALVEEDDIMIDDSDDQGITRNRTLRKRTQREPQPVKEVNSQKGRRGRPPSNWNRGGCVAEVGKKKKKKGEEEESDYGEEEEQEPYDQEEEEQVDKDNYYQEYDEEEDDQQDDYDDLDESESRYGLRGRQKRQKTSKDEDYTSQKRQFIPKVNDQFVKRNEKNGIVCACCLKSDPQYCPWFCHSYCQRFFHEECKDIFFPNSKNQQQSKSDWVCDDCLENKAACFCCKVKSQILIIPKKGKPQAPGQPEMSIQEELDQEDEEELDDQEDDEESIDAEQLEENIEQDIEQNEQEESKSSQQQEQKEESEEEEGQINENEEEDISQQEENVQKEQYESKEEKDSQVTSNKIIINTTLQLDTEKDKIEQPKLIQATSTKIVINAMSFKDQEKPKSEDSDDKKYVVRCTLGGCYKYYHVSCVYKNKNVSCINSKKVQRFRCPLHYCEICQASGDSVLIVQCVSCPTAYHLKCLPQDVNAIRLTKKYIICGKHNMKQQDYPKYEEKANYTQSGISKLSFQNMYAEQFARKGLKDKRRKKLKKRGRRPKQTMDEEYGSEIRQQSSIGNRSMLNREGSSQLISMSDNKILGQKGRQNETPKPLFQVIKVNKNQTINE